MPEQLVFRADRGTVLKAPHQSVQGHLRFDGYATRIGVFDYLDAEGNSYKELRHPDDVFAEDSLNSLGGVPLTLLHPKELVTPQNFQKYGIGTVGDEVDITINPFVRVVGNVQRKDGIDAIAKGIHELSCGYTCLSVPESGVYDGIHYDRRQRQIRYNHLAIVPKGRAGSDVRINFDDFDTRAIAIQPERERIIIPMSTTKVDHIQGELLKPPMLTLKIDDQTSFDVEPYIHAAVVNRFKTDASSISDLIEENKKLKAQLSTAEDEIGRYKKMKGKLDELGYADFDAAIADIDSHAARADQLDEEVTKLKGELETAKSTKTDSVDVLPLVRARVALERKADALLPKEFKADEASDRQIMEAAIANTSSKKFDEAIADLANRSDDYVSARFDAALEMWEKRDSTVNLRKASEDAKPGDPPPAPEAKLDAAEQARLDMINDIQGVAA